MVEIIIAVAAVLVLAGVIVISLFHYGIFIGYHPMKKPKDNAIRVACVGDSITYGFFVRNWKKNNYPAVLGRLLGDAYCVNNFSYTNRAVIKDADYPLVKEKVYKESLDFKPDIVIIMLGANDTKVINWDRDKLKRDYAGIIDSYLSLESKPKVYLLAPLPFFEVRGKVLYDLRKDIVDNELYPITKDLAKAKDLEFIDVYKVFEGRSELFVDGIHPNAKGSKLLAEKVYEALKADKK